MERGGRTLDGVRRYTWTGDNLILEKEKDLQLDRKQVTHQLHIMNAQTWQAGVLSISYPNGSNPVADPKPYAQCISHIKSVKGWFIAGEYNTEGIFHAHVMALTLQRSDSFRRSIEREWFVHRFEYLNAIDNKDPELDVLKMQKCHKPESLAAYMCKDPVWMCTSDKHYTNILSSVYVYDLGERFRIKQQEKLAREQANDVTVNKIVSDVLNVIYDHSCKTIEDCMKAAPDVMSQYLHRAGFSAIVHNCLTFVSATAHGWSLNRIATKYDPNPNAIHKCLLHQGLDVEIFDLSFYKWITKQMSKHNTFVLWGPSNTGKSAFISGFKQCVSWGEIVNTNNFAFEGLINNNIGVWEEPLISPELAEKAKQIFEGMECSIPVKFKKPIKLPRIPIIMTTNHAPWRFCTHEEPMFRNRMFIFHWDFDMSTTNLTYRNSSTSCECNSCKASSGRSVAPNNESTSRMSREQPAIQLDGATNKAGNVRPRSMHATGNESLDRPTGSGSHSRSDNLRYSSSSSGAEQQRTDSSGPSIGTSTSTGNRVRASGTDRSSNSDIGVQRSESGYALAMVSDIDRFNHGNDTRRDRVGGDGDDDPGEGPSNSRRVIPKHDSRKNVVVLGKRKETAKNKVSTKKCKLGGEVEPLTIPTRVEWLMYLSYLQLQHG
uniref:Nonstructural protein 1 n=1 Tax=Hamaparvovirinae sp. TaxID=2809447 RepID=A0AAU7P195_9VIRU